MPKPWSKNKAFISSVANREDHFTAKLPDLATNKYIPAQMRNNEICGDPLSKQHACYRLLCKFNDPITEATSFTVDLAFNSERPFEGEKGFFAVQVSCWKDAYALSGGSSG